MPDTTVRVEYIGAVQNFSEVTITGNQQVWRIGSSAFVETGRASQLVASGKFRSLANDPAMLPANQAKVGVSTSGAGTGNLTLGGVDAGVAKLAVPYMALLGNSITARNSNYANGAAPTGTTFLYGGSGYAVWANILSGQRVKLPKNYIFGFPSKTVGEVYNLGMASVLALNPAPSLIVVGDATNNIVKSDGQQTFDAIINGVTISGTYYPGLIDTITACRTLGARVVLQPINPRSDVVLTASQVDVAMRVNRWIINTARAYPGIYTPDYLRAIVDPASTLYAGKSAWTIDLLHPNIQGGYWMGKGLASIISQLFPAVDRLPLNNAVVDTANAPYAPRNPNPMLTGSGGSLANSATGTVPTGYTLGKVSGADAALTVAGSVVTAVADPNYTIFQMALGGNVTSSGMSGANADITHGARLYGNITGTDLLAGDVVEAYCAVEVDANPSGIACPTLIIRDGPNTYYNHACFPGDGGGLPSEAWSGVLYTGEFVVPTNAPALQYHHNVYTKGDTAGTVNVSANIRYGRTAVFKV